MMIPRFLLIYIYIYIHTHIIYTHTHRVIFAVGVQGAFLTNTLSLKTTTQSYPHAGSYDQKDISLSFLTSEQSLATKATSREKC